VNPVIEQMQNIKWGKGTEVEDILYGLAHTDHDEKPLIVGVLFAILQSMEIINSREIQLMLMCGDRQARKYMQAIKAALPFITKAINKNNRNHHAQEKEIPAASGSGAGATRPRQPRCCGEFRINIKSRDFPTPI
jgi:hypothetical protein